MQSYPECGLRTHFTPFEAPSERHDDPTRVVVASDDYVMY